AAETAFSVGRELALALEPASSYDEVLQRQAITAEATLLDQMGVDIPFSAARDIRPSLQAAEKEQILTPSDLTEAAACLKTAVRARRTVARLADRLPGLALIADRIGDFGSFTDAVEAAIDDRGEVADSASEALATVRREL